MDQSQGTESISNSGERIEPLSIRRLNYLAKTTRGWHRVLPELLLGLNSMSEDGNMKYARNITGRIPVGVFQVFVSVLYPGF